MLAPHLHALCTGTKNTPFAIVVFAIVLGGCHAVPEGRLAVDDVTVRGPRAVGTEAIEDKIATAPSPKFLGLFQGFVNEYSIFDHFILQRDLARIEATYRKKGYYEAHARAGRVIARNARHVRVEIVVEKGRPVLVRRVTIDGLDGVPKNIRDAVQSVAKDGLPKDSPFDEDAFENTERAIARVLSDHGYAFATSKGEAAVDVVARAADVFYTVTPGPACTFGPLTIDGLGPIPERPVRAVIDIKEGAPFSQSAVEAAQRAVMELGVFASVEFTRALPSQTQLEPPAPPTGKRSPQVIPMHAKVEVSRLRAIHLGGGFEFDALKADAHGVVGWEHRNWFGGMRTLSITFRPGVVLYPLRVNNIAWPTHPLLEERTSIDFRQPSFLERRTAGFVRQRFDVFPVLIDPNPPANAPVLGYTEFKNAVGVDRTFGSVYVAFSHNLQVDSPFSYIGPSDPTLSTILTSYPELFVALDRRDDKIRTRRGIYLANTVQVAAKPWFSNAHDIKVQPEVRVYTPLSKQSVFAARASIGFLEPTNYGTTITHGLNEVGSNAEQTRDFQLTFLRGFFSGGPSSNRGYPIRGVGPSAVVPFLSPVVALGQVSPCTSNECRSPTGGFTLWETSVELRHTMGGPISAAVFCDASDVSPQPNDIRLSHPHLSCGFGVRYDTAAGPIRVDLGYRIPGLQVIGKLTPDENIPPNFVGIPMAVHLGVGEAY
ncbi:MAG: BamA/TamA family outer membrane protein [Polyangiaceae bacterium]|nr:BamA/TamA family outer membrane protein [Polyangiaceae bacterium]